MPSKTDLHETAVSRFPFGIAACWYVVGYSEELKPGAMARVHYFDRELILFRGEDGTPAMIDAYCDHLGAHLGFGGKVVGNGIQCPFHHWEWGADGLCKRIPYATIIPPSARINSYPVTEHSGFIFAWYHPDGAAPAYAADVIPQFGMAGWSPEWRTDEWTIRTHPQEVYENGVDWPHFATVHEFEMPSKVESQYVEHRHIWGIDSAAEMLDGRTVPVRQDGRVYGLGYATTHVKGAMEFLVFVATTPVSETHTHLRLATVFNLETVPVENREQVLADYSKHQSFLLQQDFDIWENKKYMANPKLCHRDGPIGTFRAWAAQFHA